MRRKKRKLPTREEILEIIRYDPLTGAFFHAKDRAHNAKAGDRIKTYDPTRNVHNLKIFGKYYKAHRVAWLIHHGYWPPAQVDHRDNDPNNNRINNLRLASNRQNSANQPPQKNNTTGYKGVTKYRGTRYRASICSLGKSIHLGIFETPQAAARAYDSAASQIFGEYAWLNGV